MMKRFIAVFITAVMIISLFSGCGGNDELNIAFPVSENIRTLDPQFATSTTAETIAVNCFEGLVSADENGELIPGAADSWEKHGLVYTFTLRPDAVWELTDTAKEGMKDKLPADFAPAVTANDFVFAFRRLADPATKAPSAYLFGCIKNFKEALEGKVPPTSIGVTALSDYSLKIELAYDDADFLGKLTEPSASPCNEQFFNACGGRYGLMTKYIMTNGPFRFSRWNTDVSFRISRSKSYTGKVKASPATVWFYLNDDPAKMNRKLAENVYTAGNTANAPFDASSLDKELTAVSTSDRVYSLIFNCGGAVTGVKSIRAALLSAVDRKNFEISGKELTSGILPAVIEDSLSEKINSKLLPSYSESAAKASLSAALAALDTTSAEISVLCEPEYEAVLKEQMLLWQKTLGVSMSVKIRAVPQAELFAAVESGDFEAAFYPICAESERLTDFLRKFTSNNSENITNFNSPEYDALFAEVSSAANEQALIKAENDALKFLADNCVWYPVYSASSYYVCRKDVSGIYSYGRKNLIYFANAKEN